MKESNIIIIIMCDEMFLTRLFRFNDKNKKKTKNCFKTEIKEDRIQLISTKRRRKKETNE